MSAQRSTHPVAASWNQREWDIFNAFQDSAYVRYQMDIQTGALWDSLELKPGDLYGLQPLSQLFARGPIGRTQADTNMIRCGELLPPEAFAISRLVFTFSRDTHDADLYAVAEQTYWALWIGCKYYLSGVLISMPTVQPMPAPLHICGFCAGVFANSTQCPGCGARSWSLAHFDGGDGRGAGQQFALDVKPNIVLSSRASFRLTLSSPAYTIKHPGFKLWCHLEGLHARGVL